MIYAKQQASIMMSPSSKNVTTDTETVPITVSSSSIVADNSVTSTPKSLSSSSSSASLTASKKSHLIVSIIAEKTVESEKKISSNSMKFNSKIDRQSVANKETDTKIATNLKSVDCESIGSSISSQSLSPSSSGPSSPLYSPDSVARKNSSALITPTNRKIIEDFNKKKFDSSKNSDQPSSIDETVTVIESKTNNNSSNNKKSPSISLVSPRKTPPSTPTFSSTVSISPSFLFHQSQSSAFHSPNSQYPSSNTRNDSINQCSGMDPISAKNSVLDHHLASSVHLPFNTQSIHSHHSGNHLNDALASTLPIPSAHLHTTTTTSHTNHPLGPSSFDVVRNVNIDHNNQKRSRSPGENRSSNDFSKFLKLASHLDPDTNAEDKTLLTLNNRIGANSSQLEQIIGSSTVSPPYSATFSSNPTSGFLLGNPHSVSNLNSCSTIKPQSSRFSSIAQDHNTLTAISVAALAGTFPNTNSSSTSSITGSVSKSQSKGNDPSRSGGTSTPISSNEINRSVIVSNTIQRKPSLAESSDSSRHPKCSKCRNHGSRVPVKSK